MFFDLITILHKNHLSVPARFSLFTFYIKLRLIRFLANRLFSENKITKLKGLGYTFNINTLGDFYWTFREVFIEEEYYFLSKIESPKIVDCGAHIGLPVVYFKWLYPNATITAFEPLPENFILLKKNVDDNKLSDVALHKKAVANTEMELLFAGGGRAGHLVDLGEQGETKVQAVKLSDYIEDEVAYCKMDIEGAESEVISELTAGGKLNMVNMVVMEYHNNPKNSLGEIISNLEQNNFKVSFNSTLNPLKLVPRDFSHIMLTAIKEI